MYLVFRFLTTMTINILVDNCHNQLSKTMDVIIDGYNLIGSEYGLQGTLEPKRNWLVQRLSQYQKIKRFKITVVFDGWRSGRNEESLQKKDEISIVFSRLNEKADSVIVRFAREKGSGSVVVTSDRAIRSAVERFGAVAVSSGEFSRILRNLDGDSSDESDMDLELDPVEGGNPRRASKPERRREEKLKKLRL